MGVNYFDSVTSVYNAPCICIPNIGGINTPVNVSPDNGVTNGTCIHIHLTALNGPDSEPVNQGSMLPIFNPDGLVYGGQVVMAPAKILPKLTLEGHMDTPCINQNGYFVPVVTDTDGARYTYGEIIAMMVEGRAKVSSDGLWQRVDPLWFRDPWGRVYNSPRILNYTGEYVEGVPERTQFTMVLKV